MSSLLNEIVEIMENNLNDIKNNISINDIKENIQGNHRLLFNNFCESVFILGCTSIRFNETNKWEDCYDDNLNSKIDEINAILDEIDDIFHDMYYSSDEKEKTMWFIVEIINKLNKIKKTDFFVEYYDV